MSRCQECPARGAWVNLNRTQQACGTHKHVGMEDMAAALCQEGGCRERPAYAFDDAGARAIFCSQHAWNGMQNLVTNKCWVRRCPSFPVFAFPDEYDWRRFCPIHREEGMVLLSLPSHGYRGAEERSYTIPMHVNAHAAAEGVRSNTCGSRNSNSGGVLAPAGPPYYTGWSRATPTTADQGTAMSSQPSSQLPHQRTALALGPRAHSPFLLQPRRPSAPTPMAMMGGRGLSHTYEGGDARPVAPIHRDMGTQSCSFTHTAAPVYAHCQQPFPLPPPPPQQQQQQQHFGSDGVLPPAALTSATLVSLQEVDWDRSLGSDMSEEVLLPFKKRRHMEGSPSGDSMGSVSRPPTAGSGVEEEEAAIPEPPSDTPSPSLSLNDTSSVLDPEPLPSALLSEPTPVLLSSMRPPVPVMAPVLPPSAPSTSAGMATSSSSAPTATASAFPLSSSLARSRHPPSTGGKRMDKLRQTRDKKAGKTKTAKRLTAAAAVLAVEEEAAQKETVPFIIPPDTRRSARQINRKEESDKIGRSESKAPEAAAAPPAAVPSPVKRKSVEDSKKEDDKTNDVPTVVKTSKRLARLRTAAKEAKKVTRDSPVKRKAAKVFTAAAAVSTEKPAARSHKRRRASTTASNALPLTDPALTSLAARRSHRRMGDMGGGGEGMDAFYLEEAIADNGEKWMTGEVAWSKSLMFPMWPVVVRYLKLMPDGETVASIDFLGGKPCTVDCDIHNLNKYEALFPQLFHLSLSELYTDAILDSIIAYRQLHQLPVAAFYDRCGIPESKRKGFEEWLMENWTDKVERKWHALNKKTAANTACSSSSSTSTTTLRAATHQDEKKGDEKGPVGQEEKRSSSNSSSVFASLESASADTTRSTSTRASSTITSTRRTRAKTS